jgi:hypothetical protein
MKAALLKLMNDFEEQFKAGNRLCPRCFCSIQQKNACNYVICPECSLAFCFRCGKDMPKGIHTVRTHICDESDFKDRIFDIQYFKFNKSRVHKKETLCQFTPKKPFEGIFAHLWKTHGGNPHQMGVVTFTSASSIAGIEQVICTRQGGGDCNTCDWLLCDFKTMKIQPTGYAIRSGMTDTDHKLNSWVLEGSHDKTNWFLIDTRENQGQMRNCGYVDTFPVCTSSFCQFVRIRKTAGFPECSCGAMYIHQFELFGSLVS